MDVFGDRKRMHQLEMLMHHADPSRDRLDRRRKGLRIAVDDDLTGIGLVNPGEDVHQGGFAGAVFAEQCMNLAAQHFEIDRLIGDDAGKILTDTASEARSGAFPEVAPRRCWLLYSLAASGAGAVLRRAGDQIPLTPSIDQAQL